MKIASLTEDRKKLVRALEEETGEKANYMGAPSFNYEVGPYTVTRDGTILVEDAKADEAVLAEMTAKGLLKNNEGTTDEMPMIVSLPLSDHTGRSLCNMVNMIHSKEVLLSKAVGCPGFYQVSDGLIKELSEKAPQTTADFIKIITAAGKDALSGIAFEDEKIEMLFPGTQDSDRIQTYMQLTELMGKMARRQQRVHAAKCKDTNEKYTFRVWLMRLGMMGDEYKVARKILLKNLKGHTAFRTKSQAEVAKEKLKLQREAERNTADELAFEEL